MSLIRDLLTLLLLYLSLSLNHSFLVLPVTFSCWSLSSLRHFLCLFSFLLIACDSVCMPNYDGSCEEECLIQSFACVYFSLFFPLPLSYIYTSLCCSAWQVEYDGLTGRVEFNSKGQRTNYTLRILEKHRGGHKEVRSHLLSCSSQFSSPIGCGLVTGHSSDFTMPGAAFNSEVSVITDSPDGSQISLLCEVGLMRFSLMAL